MPWQAVPIVGGSAADSVRPYSSQDSINYIPEASEAGGTQTPTILRGAPGMDIFVDDSTGAHERGAHNVEGRMFRVVGTVLQEVMTDGTTTSRGTIGGSGRVSMQHNQIASGSQLAIGTGGSLGYVFNTVTNTLSQITDSGFPGGHVIGYVDSYTIWIDPTRAFWYVSDLADATSYNELQRYDAEAAPDKIVGGIVSHNLVFIFGARTTEIFQDAGTQFGTFQRIQQMIVERGCASVFGAVNLDNAVILLGDDGIWYRFDGTTPIRISNHQEEEAIQGLDWSKCFTFTWSDRGHVVAYWTFPDGHTVGFDVSTRLWHRRQSYRLKRWRANSLTRWNGNWYAGDAFNGNFYRINWDTYHEGYLPLMAERVTGTLHADGNRVAVDAVRLFMDTGKPSPYTIRTQAWYPLADSGVDFLVDNLKDGTTWDADTSIVASDGTNPNGMGVVFLFTSATTVRVTLKSYDYGGSDIEWKWNDVTESQANTAEDPTTEWNPVSFIANVDADSALIFNNDEASEAWKASFLIEALVVNEVEANDHVVEIAYSKDGGYNFGNWRKCDLQNKGRYRQPIIWRRFGTQRHWIFKVRVTSPCKRDIIGASAMMRKFPS